MLPKRLAIIKCQAHKKGNDFVIKGNNIADSEAKKASGCQEKRKEPCAEAETTCPIAPGDQVYLRVFRRKWNEPRREGPYKVTAATSTAVQVEGSNAWYHLNHCTRVPKEKTRTAGDNRQETTEQESQRVGNDEGAGQNNENNDPDNMPAHHMLVTSSSYHQHHDSEYHNPDSGCHNSDDQPYFPAINFSALSKTH
ncbi:hypothetical protein Q8A67_000035 [Cirrhinus molitorella]|uniref:Murine leukemia virus integrase C-terminal domain-containing protein n=1 Tax=Cirrhinus molitorella TaxID=172907 RepID=A0AA88Q7C5_9TELE|nr:hypothetical protein Q8A67_000035 [Cirrhinus molitorella]